MTEEQPGTSFNPNAINEVPTERVRFPERYSREGFEAPVDAAVTEFERTPEGYLEIEWQYNEAGRALALDFEHFVSAAYTREQLEQLVEPQVAKVNEYRAGLEQPADPLDVTKINDRVLRHMIRPVWQEHLPDGTDAGEKQWEQFKGQYPEHMQINLDELRELDGKMRVLSNDTEVTAAVREIRAERVGVMRAASSFMAADRKIDVLSHRMADIYRAAAVSNRSLTGAEQRHVERLQAQQTEVSDGRGRQITSPEMLADVKVELRRRINIERRRDFERGLVMTSQMKEVIDELLPSLAAGKPALLVGETGGAKTALAEYISREYFGKEPEFISGNADANVYQLMGKQRVRSQGGVEDYFQDGPVLRAMKEGKPLILDEINAMHPDLLKRFNKIIQMRPGDTFRAQEDSNELITIKPGFVIIGTANEKSKRYKGVEDLSVEFQNRFGANVVRVRYPDHNVVYGQAPVENAIIARAALTDRSGDLVGIEAEELERFVRACHVTQQVFSGNHGRGYDMYVSSDDIADGKPGLDEAVLAPRTMVALLEKVRDSYGKVTLDQAIERFVSGVKSPKDRQTLKQILDGQGFLRTPD